MDVGKNLLTPEGLADRLPSRPLLTTTGTGAHGLTLQRFRHPPSTIDVPGLRDELLVDHLAGPVLVEEDLGSGKLERRWTNPGQVTVTPARQPVRRILRGSPDVVLLHVAPELLHDVAGEIYGQAERKVALVRRLAVPDHTADRLVRLLLAEAETPGPASFLMMEALAGLGHPSAAVPLKPRHGAAGTCAQPSGPAHPTRRRANAVMHGGRPFPASARRDWRAEPLAVRASVPRRHGRAAAPAFARASDRKGAGVAGTDRSSSDRDRPDLWFRAAESFRDLVPRDDWPQPAGLASGATVLTRQPARRGSRRA